MEEPRRGEVAFTSPNFDIAPSAWQVGHAKLTPTQVDFLLYKLLCLFDKPKSLLTLAPSLSCSDALWSTAVLYTCINSIYCTLLCLICTVKHTVPIAMVKLYRESLICLHDGFFTLTGSLPWVGLVSFVDLMSEQQMFTAFWKRSISDPIHHSTVWAKMPY